MARNHLRALDRVGVRAAVVGVHDRSRGQADEFASLAGAPAFSSLQDLLDETRPDVVHVCTPPSAHFEAAHAAIAGGADVYVEKPFALTKDDARRLLDLARTRGRLVCAGHQLLRDPAFGALLARAADLGDLVQADSHFAFRPAGAGMARASARALARQLVDVLPHPLYALIAVLERFAPPGAAIEIDWVRGGPADLHAVLRAGDVVGRLSVTLRGRPVASSITLSGTRGTLTCDLVRSILVGAANPGTEALEKVLNPIVEGVQLISRTARSVAGRVRNGVSYPGLAEMIGAFYGAVVAGGDSPVSPEHLLRVTGAFEELVAHIHAATPGPVARGRRACEHITLSAEIAKSAEKNSLLSCVHRLCPATAGLEVGTTRAGVDAGPSVAVTGAGGFLGAEISRALGQVRGIGRTGNPDNPHIQAWTIADLSQEVPADALTGATVVVHAAAETSGDFAAHQRNTIDATRHLLRAMHEAGVSRLVLVSSLSVLRPPRTPWERQDERTPRPTDSARFGPYSWGKTEQEALVDREAPALGIAVRIVRPGALVDWTEPSLPGLMGRHLFGRWHLGLGRPQLPIAVCDVGRCAEAIAWCATHFDAAPPIVNLFDPEVATRGALAARLRNRGWTGRIVWVPISAIAVAIVTARAVLSILGGRMPSRFDAWSILRPRRFDDRIATKVLSACR
jgi:predicted dehydrogenase/nucleoside-diphosphate-sugar epimerase